MLSSTQRGCFVPTYVGELNSILRHTRIFIYLQSRGRGLVYTSAFTSHVYVSWLAWALGPTSLEQILWLKESSCTTHPNWTMVTSYQQFFLWIINNINDVTAYCLIICCSRFPTVATGTDFKMVSSLSSVILVLQAVFWRSSPGDSVGWKMSVIRGILYKVDFSALWMK